MKASGRVADDFGKRLRSKEPDGHVGDVEEFKVYSLSLEALATGGLNRARETGSRYLGMTSGRAVMGSGPSEDMSIEIGPVAEMFASIYRKIHQPSDIYELRILTLPAIQLEALWIFTPSAISTDLIIPYLNLSEHIRVREIYSDTDFVEAIKLARRDRAMMGFVPTGPD